MFTLRKAILASLTFVVLCFGSAMTAQADIITVFYGDDDGFGIGATSGTLNPVVSNPGVGEAPFTDVRLIGPGFIAPGFTPTATLTFTIPVGQTITGITLTLRTGSFDSGPNPVGGPNQIVLDGLTVNPAFISSFSSLPTDLIETRTFALDPTFFAVFADGSVSLTGTRLTEDSGSGSFQVDFLSLTITTSGGTAVPEPATMILLGTGLAGIAAKMRRRRETD